MLSIKLMTPKQVQALIAARARTRRLSLNLSREALAMRSGVSASTLKRFETSGEISLHSLLQIAIVLDAIPEFNSLFLQKAPTPLHFKKLPQPRQRGRK
jgi:transcriptional regulator with XRE-family HTH domain